MATVNGLTAERMLEIEAASVVDGNIVGDNLILTKHDASTIDAGNVRGPVGTPGVSEATFTSQLAAVTAQLNSLTSKLANDVPIGAVDDYIGIVAPNATWLTMYGQTVVDGQTLYPEFWSKIPAIMKSPPNIIMPDTRSKVSIGYNSADTDFDLIAQIRGSVGTGGAKTHTLTQAELPAVPVTVNPPSTTFSIDPPYTTITVDPPSTLVTIDCPAFNINVDPPATLFNTSEEGQFHRHTIPSFASFQVNTGTGPSVAQPFGWTTTGVQNEMHVHNVNVDLPAFAAYVDPPAFNVAVDIAPFAVGVDFAAYNSSVDIAQFNSGNMGSGSAHNNLQPYVVFLKIVKVL